MQLLVLSALELVVEYQSEEVQMRPLLLDGLLVSDLHGIEDSRQS